MGFRRPTRIAPIIPSSKQRSLVAQLIIEKEQSVGRRIAESTIRKNPQVNGGGLIEHGGDGTGFAGGVHLSYWQEMLKHLYVLAEWLHRDPIEGVDFPSSNQMEKAKIFAKYRGKET